MLSTGDSHIFTVDLEDWYHSLNPNPNSWHKFSSRIKHGADNILKLLSDNKSTATFFVLGDIAEKEPGLIKTISKEGHEIGSHGMLHKLIYTQSKEDFRKDLRQSLSLLYSITGKKVRSYRAPYFSITSKSLWALQILEEEGIWFDSSIFPIYNHRYGIPNASRTLNNIHGHLWELPISTIATPVGNFPFAGGVYLRFLPKKLIKHCISYLEKKNELIVIYIHPWELDPDHPKYKTKSRFLNFRHYFGLKHTSGKIEYLFRNTIYASIIRTMEELNVRHGNE